MKLTDKEYDPYSPEAEGKALGAGDNWTALREANWWRYETRGKAHCEAENIDIDLANRSKLLRCAGLGHSLKRSIEKTGGREKATVFLRCVHCGDMDIRDTKAIQACYAKGHQPTRLT